MENRAGRLFEITNVLGKNGINIRALSLADTSDFGILRLIVDKPDAAIEALKKENYTVSATDVVAIAVEDKPGGLSNILKILDDGHINVEYMYAFLGRTANQATMIFRFDDTQAVEKLQKSGVKLINSSDLITM